MQQEGRLISVVIPCYNCERYIEESVRSVLSQTYQGFEILCVNDGSSDATLKVLEDIQRIDSRVKVYDVPNGGGAKARNIGFENSLGDYIQFLDSDDVLLPNKFELQLKHLSEGSNLVFSDYVIKDESLNEIEFKSDLKTVEKDFLNGVIHKILITNNPIYSREIVEKVGGYTEGLSNCQDWEFHIKLALTNMVKPKFIDEVLFENRNLSNSVSNNWIEVGFHQCKIIKEYKKKLSTVDLANTTNVYITNLYLNGLVHFKENKYIEAYELKNEFKIWQKKAGKFTTGLKWFIYMIFGLKTLVFLSKKIKR